MTEKSVSICVINLIQSDILTSDNLLDSTYRSVNLLMIPVLIACTWSGLNLNLREMTHEQNEGVSEVQQGQHCGTASNLRS